MQQYLDLLQAIKEKGTVKPAARAGMPSTKSLFGYQFRHNLADGFPLLTTKEINFKHIVTELLWFLKGDTNIKYLVDNGCNIWNEDAYNFYLKKCKESNIQENLKLNFTNFVESVKDDVESYIEGYNYGDCGFQYGKLWRNFDGIDQIAELIKGLKENPESRRHILTALNPSHYNDLALFPCHCLVQFNARPLNVTQRIEQINDADARLACYSTHIGNLEENSYFRDTPKYYLDCQLYQRSADVFLGVPYNIASYALLTHIISEIVDMIPGEFIHTFGDVHIYENHTEQVDEQLSRIPSKFPVKLEILNDLSNFDINLLNCIEPHWFKLNNYNPQSKIKAKLSTGLK